MHRFPMGKKCKVIIFTSEFPPGPGGIGHHAWNLANQLLMRGFEVAVYTDSRTSFLAEERKFDAAVPFSVFRSQRGRWGRVGILHRAWLFARGIWAEGDGSCLIASGKIALWLVALVSLFSSCSKRIAVLHGSEINFPSGWKRRLSAWSLRRFHRIIAVSAFTAELALRIVPDAPIEIIPNGYEVQKVKTSPNGRLSGNPALITVGTVSPRKGQHNVVQALPQLRERFPGIRYHLVGLLQQWIPVEKLSRALGVENCVLAHGPLDDVEMVQALKGSHLFFMLSENQEDGDVEGFGIAIIEANACGLPAIGSRECGIEDAIADGYSGRLVDPKNVVEVVDAVEEIMANYETYSRNALEWAKRFTWDRVIHRYIEVIEG